MIPSNTEIGLAAPEEYDRLFSEKAAHIQTLFEEFDIPEVQTFASNKSHFRMRAEFKIWHEGNTAYYAMYRPGEYKKAIKIDDFSIGSKVIVSLMKPLLELINADENLKRKLFQIEFLSTTDGECLVTLIYHRPLNETWESAAKALESTLNIHIIGRSRKQKHVLSKDYVIETFDINGKEYRYQQVETGFTQPNAMICQKMLMWAQTVTLSLGGDLLELYCGNGNFTLVLADNFNQVLATEISKTSVNSALFNIELNKNKNIRVVRLSSEELTQAMEGTREFRRLRDVPLEEYQFSTVFVDPPRAGLDEETEKMITRFDNILYISCNPDTLKKNLKALCHSHDIQQFAFFDQFPYTDHAECGVLLQRKQ